MSAFPPARRPQLSAEELQQLKWLLGGVLTLLAVSTVSYMDVGAWVLMGITMFVTLATLAWPTLPSRVPPVVHTLAFPAIVMFFVGDLWLVTEVLPAMVRLDILLLLYRTLNYRQRRDDLQIIVLGLFLVVVAGVLTVSLLFAVHILVYTACALALLLVLTLNSTGEKTKAAPAATSASAVPPAWALHADWPQLLRRLRAIADWRVLGLGVVLFAGVVAVSAFLFLAIPRFELHNGMFLERLISKKSKSGFNERIRFGDVTDIQQDTSVALSVDVSDQSKIPASPYWRMLVLDRYQDGTFELSAELRRRAFDRQERMGAFANGAATPRRAEPVLWTFYLESGISRYLPLLGDYKRVVFREPQNFRQSRQLALIGLRSEPVAMLAYRVEDFDLSGNVRDPEFARAWAAQLELAAANEGVAIVQGRLAPEDQRALAAFAREAAGERKLSAAEFAQRVSAWLRERHGYTLSPRIPSGTGDALVRWLGSRESGHCELFAGSFVLLARSAGFPARVVTGFRGGTWNAYSNNFTVRNSDAHAWAEIFDAASGAWLRVDPLAERAGLGTEQRQADAAIAARLDRSWQARLDSLRVFWYRRIVSFDQRSQAETLKAVKEATQKSGARLREILADWMTRTKAWVAQPWDAQRVVRAALAIAAAAGVFWLWRGFVRRWWTSLTGARGRRGEDPVRREAGRWLGRLAESGNRIPETHAIVPDLQRLRFGARGTWPEPAKVFRRARQALRAARR